MPILIKGGANVGIEPNGTEVSYPVYQGQTITKGDFVTLYNKTQSYSLYDNTNGTIYRLLASVEVSTTKSVLFGSTSDDHLAAQFVTFTSLGMSLGDVTKFTIRTIDSTTNVTGAFAIKMTDTKLVYAHYFSSSLNARTSSAFWFNIDIDDETIVLQDDVVFASTLATTLYSLKKISNTKFIIGYSTGYSYGAATYVVGTLESTTVTLGTPLIVESGNTNHSIRRASCQPMGETYIVYSYCNDYDGASGGIYIGFLSLNVSTLTLVSEYLITGTEIHNHVGNSSNPMEVIDTDKILFIFQEGTVLKAMILTISGLDGTPSISEGTIYSSTIGLPLDSFMTSSLVNSSLCIVSYKNSYPFFCGIIITAGVCTFTTATQVSTTSISTNSYSPVFNTSSSSIAINGSTSSKYLLGYKVTPTITNVIEVEAKATLTAATTTSGIAKTTGTGGTDLVNGDSITIYVP